MKTHGITLISFILLFGCSSTGDMTTTPEPNKTAIKEAGIVQEMEVNGLRVVHKRIPGNPVVAVGFFLNGGTKYVPREQAGIERFLLTTAKEGTESLTKDELNGQLESMGTSIDVNAAYDYNGLTMNSLQRNFGKSFSLFTDIILNPRLDTADIELVREQMMASIKSEKDDPDSYIRLITNSLYYADHPYNVSLNGTEAAIKEISQNQLQSYHGTHVTKDRALLVVVGDIDPGMFEEKIKVLAANLSPGMPGQEQDMTGSYHPGAADVSIVERELPTNYILGYCPAPSPGAADYAAFSAGMRILDNKLFEEIRTKRNLSYAPASGVSRRVDNYGLIYVTTVSPDTTIKVMFETIDAMANTVLPEAELRNEISQAITRDLMQQETADAQVGQLALYELAGGGWENAVTYMDRLKKLTPADIQRAIATYSKNYHIGVLGDPAAVDKALFLSK